MKKVDRSKKMFYNFWTFEKIKNSKKIFSFCNYRFLTDSKETFTKYLLVLRSLNECSVKIQKT